LPGADEGVAYSQQLQLDGETQGTWSVTGGALPTGITLSSAGLLSGTATESGTFNFEVTVDGCVKDMSLVVTAAPFDCLGYPIDIQDAVWTQQGQHVGCNSGSIVAGSGSWNTTRDTGACANNNNVNMETHICNPTTAYAITVTIPWGDSGNVGGSPPWEIIFDLIVNGVQQSAVTRSLVTGPFTNVVLTGTIPAASTCLIQIRVLPQALAGPSYEAHGTYSITPLTHP
jgi:hypothetical protein